MARTRRLDDLRSDAYKRSDNEGATDRHPAADVTRYINQGGAELWDLLIAARGKEYFRAPTPQSITTLANTTSYNLNSDFYLLISVRLDGVYGAPLKRFESMEEPILLLPYIATSLPQFYELRRSATDGTSSLCILPKHRAGQTLVVDYVPRFPDLVADGDQFDGINGWEDYPVLFAAREMAMKDQEWDLKAALEGDMDRIKQRILDTAPKRDMHQARRVRDVRGPQAGWFGRRRWL